MFNKVLSIITALIISSAGISFAKDVEVNKGWNLLGTACDLSVESLNKTEVKTVWRWDRKVAYWKVWSPNKSIMKIIKSYGLPILGTIPAYSGFWVSADEETTIHLCDGVEENNGTVDLNRGLVAYWSFDNCTAVDNSGNGHDGEIHGNPECVDGIKGKALKFDGVDDFISVSYSKDLAPSSYTVTLFYKASSKDFLGEMITEGVSTHYYQIQYSSLVDDNSNAIEFWYEDASDYDYFILSPYGRDNNIHMATMVFNNKKLELSAYIDGKLVGQKTFSSPPYDNGFGLWIARGDNGYFKGIIDEIRIYNRDLSAKEIKALYEQYENGINR